VTYKFQVNIIWKSSCTQIQI